MLLLVDDVDVLPELLALLLELPDKVIGSVDPQPRATKKMQRRGVDVRITYMHNIEMIRDVKRECRS